MFAEWIRQEGSGFKVQGSSQNQERRTTSLQLISDLSQEGLAALDVLFGFDAS